MSGCISTTTCPNCGNTNADLYTDHKPYEYSTIHCIECGLSIYPKTEYSTLEELNAEREEEGFEPLTVLPEQDKSL